MYSILPISKNFHRLYLIMYQVRSSVVGTLHRVFFHFENNGIKFCHTFWWMFNIVDSFITKQSKAKRNFSKQPFDHMQTGEVTDATLICKVQIHMCATNCQMYCTVAGCIKKVSNSRSNLLQRTVCREKKTQ